MPGVIDNLCETNYEFHVQLIIDVIQIINFNCLLLFRISYKLQQGYYFVLI